MLRIRSFRKVTVVSLILLVCLPFCLNGCARPVIQSSAVNQPVQNAVGYFLPKGLIRVELKKSDKDYALTFTPVIVADQDYFYTLTYLPKGTAEDTIEIRVNANGLLESINATTEAKGPAIVKAIGEIIPAAAKTFIPASTMTKATNLREFNVLFDPLEEYVVTKVKKQLENQGLSKEGLIFNVEPLLKRKNYGNPPSFPFAVYYRLVLPYRITLGFRVTKKEDSQEIQETYYKQEIIYIPTQKSPIIGLDIKRAAFVRNVTNLTFSNGILTQYHVEKPSEVLGFMSIPLEVAKAIVAVPGSIIKLRIDTTTQQKALVTAQKELLTTQKEYLEALRALEKTKAGEGSSPGK